MFQVGRQHSQADGFSTIVSMCLPKLLWSLLHKPSEAENKGVEADTCSSKAQRGSSISHFHLLSGRWSHMATLQGRLGNVLESTSTCHSTILLLQRRETNQGLPPQRTVILLMFYRRGNWETEQWRNPPKSTISMELGFILGCLAFIKAHAFNHYAVLDL